MRFYKFFDSLKWPLCSSADGNLASSDVSEWKHSTLEPRPTCAYLRRLLMNFSLLIGWARCLSGLCYREITHNGSAAFMTCSQRWITDLRDSGTTQQSLIFLFEAKFIVSNPFFHFREMSECSFFFFWVRGNAITLILEIWKLRKQEFLLTSYL